MANPRPRAERKVALGPDEAEALHRTQVAVNGITDPTCSLCLPITHVSLLVNALQRLIWRVENL